MNYYTEISDGSLLSSTSSNEDEDITFESSSETSEESYGWSVYEKPTYQDHKNKANMVNELKQLKLYPDFGIQLHFIEVMEELKRFDRSTLKDPNRTHWVKWFKSFFS